VTSLAATYAALAAGDADFAAEAVAIAELGAERNPGVASFEGLALNLRARLDADLGQLADAAKILQTSPRPALRALGDPDAFPAGDLGLQRSARALGLPHDAAGLEAHAERWRPWRRYAAHYLWAAGA